jgi:ferrochelatase
VLLVNLGTPAAPTASAIRRFLREFLSDPRVVELPRIVWLPLLYGLILPLRPARLAEKYRAVWTDQGSPLLQISKRQAQALAAELSRRQGVEIAVGLGMRYGEPSIDAALRDLESQGVRRLLVLPLYPQYSATTTASAFDAVFVQLRNRRALPELRTINQYHDHPGYIAALADSVRTHRAAKGSGDHLLMSFHGIPQHCVDRGDPYFDQCQETGQLLAQALHLESGRWSISFQSRLGKAQWLQPYTDAEVRRLAAAGIKTLDVICPGFSADCLETLEEVALRYAEDFKNAGGKELRYVPALNDAPAHIGVLADLVAENLRSGS